MLDAEANRRERVLDFVRHLARHFSPGENARGACERRRIIERDDAPVGRRAEPRELHANLPAADLEFAVLNHVAILGEEPGDGVPHRRPRGGGRLRQHVARLQGLAGAQHEL